MTVEYLDSKRIQGLGLTDGTKIETGYSGTNTASLSELSYKQITGLSEGDIISATLWDIRNASSGRFATGLYSDDSNQPDELLYNGSDKCIGTLTGVNAGQGSVSFTTIKIPLDVTYTVPSGVDKVWVALMPDQSVTVKANTESGGSYAYSVYNSTNTEHGDYDDNTPHGTWVMDDDARIQGNGSNNYRAGVVVNAGIVDDKATLGTTVYSSGIGTTADITSNASGTLSQVTGSGDPFTSGSELQTGCLEFDGSTRVRTGNLQLIPRSDFTVAFWTKADSFSTAGSNSPRYLHADGNSMILELGNNADPKIINFHVSTASGTNAVEVAHGMSTGTWYHLAFVYDASNGDMIIYRDSTAIATDTSNPYSLPIKEHTSWWEFGGGSNEYMDGQINDFAVWNKKLTSTQIGTLYGNGTNTVKRATSVDKENIVAYWDGSDGTITVPNKAVKTTTYDLPENTIFNEINTYKQYWLQDNEWKHGSLKEAFTASGYTGSSYTNLTWTYKNGVWSAGGNFPRSDKGIYGASFGGNAKAIAGGGGDGDSGSSGSYSSYTYDGSSWSSAINWDSGRGVREARGGAGDKDGATFMGGKNYDNNSKNWAMKFNGSSWSNLNEPPWSWRNGGSSGKATGGLWISGYNSSGASANFDGYNFASITNCTVTGHAGTAGADSKDNGVYRQGDDFVKWNGSSWATLADGLASSSMDSGGGGGTSEAFMMIGSPSATNPVEIWTGTTWTVGNEPTATYDAPSSNGTVG